MPTKPNRAGQQQNYVPQGNGDASGEYADHSSGSNKHFTNFKQPEQPKTTDFNNGVTNKKDTKTTLKDRLQFDDAIENTMREEYKRYLTYGVSEQRIKEKMTERLIDGNYGMITRSKKEMGKGYVDYYDAMEEWLKENRPEKYYYKRGNEWKVTYNPSWVNKKLYTESEYQEKIAKEQIKNLKQSNYDIEINKNFGEECAVAFGKNYSKEYMEQVVESSKRIVADFPEMKGFIKAIGDRNSLEKLTQARARASLTEENINKVANEIIRKQKEIFNREISLEDAKEKARTQILNGGLSLTRSGSRTLAYWSPSQRALVMLPKTSNDDANINQIHYYQVNWHSSNKPMATYYHEFGHAIDSMIADYYKQKERNFIKKDFSTYQKLNAIRMVFNDEMREFERQNISSAYKDEYVKRYNEIAGTSYKDKNELDMELRKFYSRQRYETVGEVEQSLKRDGIKKYAISEYGNTNGQEFLAECFSAYYTGMNNELANKVVERVKKFYNDIRGFE